MDFNGRRKKALAILLFLTGGHKCDKGLVEDFSLFLPIAGHIQVILWTAGIILKGHQPRIDGPGSTVLCQSWSKGLAALIFIFGMWQKRDPVGCFVFLLTGQMTLGRRWAQDAASPPS